MLSLAEFGLIFNVVGLIASLLLSLGVACVYRRPFFLYWTASYAVGAPALALGVMGQWGDQRSLLLGVFLLPLYGGLLLQAAKSLEARPLSRGWAAAIAGLMLGSAGAAMAGCPWWVLYLGSAAWSSFCYIRLGLTLLRLRLTGASWSRPTLVVLMFAFAAWLVTSTMFLPTSLLWIGFVGAGLFHFFLGLVMAVFLLELQAGDLRAINAELTQLDARKTNFIATVNHELRTPLSVIRGSADLLEEELVGPLTAEQNRLVRTITRQVEQLGGLIHDMLDFSNLHFAQRPAELEPEDLAALARHAVENFTGPYEKKGVSLALRLEDETQPCQLDRQQVARVLNNLLANALKFTPAGGSVTVSLCRESDAALLSVTDTGIGIDGEDLDQLFTRFYQGRRAAEGAGLGLAICRSIVEESHHGRISVESRLGEGTTFRVRLPLEPPGARPSPLAVTG